AACRLKVAIGERAYPDIGPCWRDRECLDPLEHILFEEPGAVGAGVGKAGPCLFSPNARPGIGNVPETRGLCGILRVDDRLNVGWRLKQQETSFQFASNERSEGNLVPPAKRASGRGLSCHLGAAPGRRAAHG